MSSRPPRDRPPWILPVIVVSQFAGTSLWFAGNAILGDLQREWELGAGALGWLTSSVQLGFIVGTLIFALANLADRIPSRVVFVASAWLGAIANAAIALELDRTFTTLVLLRFLVGVFLAGIYPVGMKIAASWYARGLGHALGLLVGALVLGTAFPHLLRAGSASVDWRTMMFGISAMAALGGTLLFAFVPTGPHLPARSPFDPGAIRRIFRDADFRAAALGYFGHMWELYAFWAFVPILVAALADQHQIALDVSLWSFAIIGVGAVGCVVGGVISQRRGSAWVAAVQIGMSAFFCVASPFVFALPMGWTLAMLLLWGIVVVGDSPQFSALNAATAPRELVGTALTIVTCVGFLLTIPSIQVTTWLSTRLAPQHVPLAWVLGPLLGWMSVRRLIRRA